jgi:hypothetical protein
LFEGRLAGGANINFQIYRQFFRDKHFRKRAGPLIAKPISAIEPARRAAGSKN